MDDERAAIDEPIQRLEQHGKGLTRLDFLSTQSVQMPRAGIFAGIEDGVELLAGFTRGVER